MREKLSQWLEMDLSETLYQKFEMLWQKVIHQNEHTNTTRILAKEDFFIKNILDSLLITQVYSELLMKKLIIADVGCGGGFPCLPLAIINTKLSICGIDSNNYRCNKSSI